MSGGGVLGVLQEHGPELCRGLFLVALSSVDYPEVEVVDMVLIWEVLVEEVEELLVREFMVMELMG